VLVVHRSRYDDWTLPKGKSDDAETPEMTALREVHEETGVQPRIVGSLGKSRYKTEAETKVVNWFSMREVRADPFDPNEEVDEVRWVPLAAAATLLTYKNDVEVLRSLNAKEILTTGTLLLVRHGNAGSRAEWDGDDSLRPLSNRGEHQATAIADALSDRSIERILTSPYRRCRQTVEPLAAMLNLKIEERDELAEGTGHRPARDLCRELIGINAVLCSHGDVIPAVLDWMVRHGTSLKSPFDCKKGSTWEIEVKAGEFRKARYLPPPL
jgi:8-oxo-dGTP diphosphatase